MVHWLCHIFVGTTAIGMSEQQAQKGQDVTKYDQKAY